MRIRYWTFALTKEQEKVARKKDGRYIKEDLLQDFLARELYGPPSQYSLEQNRQHYITVMLLDMMTDAGIMTVDKLKEILFNCYRIEHPDDPHPRTYDIIESFVPEKR